jgi:hypothetical protein
MMLSCEPSPDMLILSVGLSMALMPHRIYRASGFVRRPTAALEA